MNFVQKDRRLEEVKEELKGEQQLTDRYETIQGGQGMQGGEVVIISEPPQDVHAQKLIRLEQKIDMIMETQQQQMRGNKPMESKKQWKKSTSLYQRGQQQIVIGPTSMRFHGHIAPVTTGARVYQNSINIMNPRGGKISMRLKTAGGPDENSNSTTRLEKSAGRAISTAADYTNIQSLNAVYQNQIQKKEKTQSMNNFEAKLKNLKKMYNNQVKNDYTSDISYKTSIRNKKNRISHDIGSTGMEGKRLSDASVQMKPVTKKLVINDAYQETVNLQRVQKSMGVTKSVTSPQNNPQKKFVPQFKKHLQPLDISEIYPISVSSQERPLAPVIAKANKLTGSRQGDRNPKISTDFDENFKKKQTIQSIYQNPFKKEHVRGQSQVVVPGKYNKKLEPLTRAEDTEKIENLSDYENTNNENTSMSIEANLAISKGGSKQKNYEKISRFRPNRSPSKFENAAARYKAEAVEYIPRNKLVSPYNQILGPNLKSTPSTADKGKRQLAIRQQRLPPQIQGILYNVPSPINQIALNHLKVQKAYQSGKKQKPDKKVNNEQKVKKVIDKINLKIDDLNLNLQNYEQVIDLTLKEIPKDIRSMNNSNFNSSSRQQQSDRTQHMLKTTQQDNVSDKTLKTIMDFHSERAHTQQQKRMQYKHESTQMINIDNSRPMDMSHLSSQINSHDYYRIVTSRHSRNRREYLAKGMMSPGENENVDESGHFDLNANLNMTHDQIQMLEDNILITQDDRNMRKGFNLTNLSIKINENNQPGPKQKTERNNKTSLTNLQSYLQQRGINNETNLSNSNAFSHQAAIFNPSAPINIRNFLPQQLNNSVLGSGHDPNSPNGAREQFSVVSSPGVIQNFYPPYQKSRLSQKSAILDMQAINTAQLKTSNNLQDNNDY